LSDASSRGEGPGWNVIEQGPVSEFIDPVDPTMIEDEIKKGGSHIIPI